MKLWTLGVLAFLLILLTACGPSYTPEEIQNIDPSTVDRSDALRMCYANAEICGEGAPGIVREFKSACLQIYNYGSVESVVEYAQDMCEAVSGEQER